MVAATQITYHDYYHYYSDNGRILLNMFNSCWLQPVWDIRDNPASLCLYWIQRHTNQPTNQPTANQSPGLAWMYGTHGKQSARQNTELPFYFFLFLSGTAAMTHVWRANEFQSIYKSGPRPPLPCQLAGPLANLPPPPPSGRGSCNTRTGQWSLLWPSADLMWFHSRAAIARRNVPSGLWGTERALVKLCVADRGLCQVREIISGEEERKKKNTKTHMWKIRHLVQVQVYPSFYSI